MPTLEKFRLHPQVRKHITPHIKQASQEGYGGRMRLRRPPLKWEEILQSERQPATLKTTKFSLVKS